MKGGAVLLLLAISLSRRAEASSPGPVTDDPSSAPATPGPATSLCVMWRQTGACRADGPREPHYDKDCGAEISRFWSGFCECAGFTVGFDCGQATRQFTCGAVCANPPPPPTPAPPLANCEEPPVRTEPPAGPAPAPAPSTAAIPNPEEYVNTRWGTKGGGGNDHGFDRGTGISSGNLYPQVVSPWGFNAWSVVTDDLDSQWWFKPWDWQFNGIRCTHQPSPWLGDWGNFVFFPMMVQERRFADRYQTSYNPLKSEWRPYYFKTALTTYATAAGRTTVEVTSTTHAAVIRVRYPPKQNGSYAGYDETRKLVFQFPGDSQPTEWNTTAGGSPTLEGWTITAPEGKRVRLFYSVEIETKASVLDTVVRSGRGTTTYALFDTDGDEFVVRVATSLVGVCQARLNRIMQVGGRTFDEVMAGSKAEWRATLGKVDVRDAGNQGREMLEVLYTSLFRASLYPRFISETDRDGKEIHLSTYTTGDLVRPGPAVTDSGSWDAYVTVYPLLSLLDTKVLGRMIQGWTNAYNESGVIPQWASPGHRNMMVGTMADSYFADAIVNEIEGFDVAAAYEAMRNDAFGNVRAGMSDYLQYGYLRSGSQAVAVTLNHMMADWSAAQAAKKLGKMDDYAVLLARSQNYSKIFNNETGFFQRRGWSGSFVDKSQFDEFAWGGDYTEGGPWQYRFYVPHDPKGLAALYREAGLDMCEKIEEAMRMTPAVHLGAYSKIVHEMSEMVNNCWGQYAHNNQPSHHMVYMLIAMSDAVTDRCSQVGQAYLRRTVTETYHASVDMFAGDEDNGEMSAWFVLTSLGLYQLAPGSGEYTLGIPLFRDVAVSLPNGNTLRVTTDERTFDEDGDDRGDRGDDRDDSDKKGKGKGNGKGKKDSKRHGKGHDHHNDAGNWGAAADEYDATAFVVKEVTFNGVPVTGTSIKYFDIMKGGNLHFKLAPGPSVRGA